MNKSNQTLMLSNGYTLGYAEWGDPDGKSIFHFHGSSSSRLEHPIDDTHLLGIRLITVDRPGHGLSDFYQYELIDWANMIEKLADHLGIEKFAVSGWSFGGAFAMACAYQSPDRIKSAGLVSSFVPYNRPNATQDMAGFNKFSLGLAHRMPWGIVRIVMKLQGNALKKDPEKFARQVLSTVPDSDKEILTNQEVIDMLIPSMIEAYRASADGAAWEGAMLVRDWGFRLEDIHIPVYVWHGTEDIQNPLQCAEYIEKEIPAAQLITLPNEGHFHIFNHWGEIMKTLST